MLSGEEGHIAGHRVVDRKKKLLVPAPAKLVHHATLTERGPWWTTNGANIDVKQLAPGVSQFFCRAAMEDTSIAPITTQQRHL